MTFLAFLRVIPYFTRPFSVLKLKQNSFHPLSLCNPSLTFFSFPSSSFSTMNEKISYSNDKNQKITIGYVTDCEGNYDYWQRYVASSSILKISSWANSIENSDRFHSTQPTSISSLASSLYLKENCHMVYGGDVCDRGAGDLRLLCDLIELKRRYPDRVHFIIGNRDCNKLRLLFELHADSSLKASSKVYWIRENASSRSSSPQRRPDGAMDINVTKPIASDHYSLSSRLQWILSKTMGAPLAFEYRRAELQTIRSNQSIPSDHEVAQSFLDTIDPRYIRNTSSSSSSSEEDTRPEYAGLLLEYLRHAKIVCQIGDTLFVHGAIHSYNLGWLPPGCAIVNDKDQSIEILGSKIEELRATGINITNQGVYINDFHVWMNSLNQFVKTEIEDYIQNAESYLQIQSSLTQSQEPDSLGLYSPMNWAVGGGYSHAQPGSRLLQYGMGWLADRTVNPSVIYATYAGQGKIREPTNDVMECLKVYGIQRLVVGHQPHGDAPLIIDSGNGFKVICGDTSYSRNTLWHSSQQTQSIEVSDLPYELSSTKDSDWQSISTDRIHEIIAQAIGHDRDIFDSIPTEDNTRGISVSEILIDTNTIYYSTTSSPPSSSSIQSNVRIGGQISNGMRYSIDFDNSLIMPYLGKKTKDGWSIKTLIDTSDQGENKYDPQRLALLSRGEGYDCKNLLVPIQQIESLL